MTVDPAVIYALANLIQAGMDALPVEDDAEWHGFEEGTAEAMQDILDELTTADLIPAVRAAAFRLAAREAAGRG
jgi:hypothetical protein